MTQPITDPSSSVPTKDSSLSDWIYYMQQIHVSAIDMGLSRVIPVAHHLGLIDSAKQDAYVFTVAGTNGKGSTTAVISEICQQTGYKTALYQSPHLIDFNERIRIDGRPVDDRILIDAFCAVEQARLVCELTVSFFEMTTLAAMLIFAKAKCDVWVLEVGLGGRLDVVNIIDPDLTVITNIGIDHVDWLGDTRDKIGYEKAGILREGIPLVYGENDMPESIKQKVESLHVPLFQFGRDFDFFYNEKVADNVSVNNAVTNASAISTSAISTSAISTRTNTQLDNQSDKWQFSSASVTLQLPKPALSLINTTNAMAAVLASSLNIKPSHITQALQKVKLAGRFDYRQIKDRHWLFDVAHNERGVNFLLSQFTPLWEAHKIQYPTAKLRLIFSMLADKDIRQVVDLFVVSGLPITDWHIAEIDHPRAATIGELATVLKQYPQNKVYTYECFQACTQGAIDKSNPEDLILVCGSFHTIGEILQALNQQAFR